MSALTDEIVLQVGVVFVCDVLDVVLSVAYTYDRLVLRFGEFLLVRGFKRRLTSLDETLQGTWLYLVSQIGVR